MKLSTSAALVALSMLATNTAHAAEPAAPTVIKTATVLPEGTVWYQAVKDMGTEWGTATSDRVTMRLYAGGIAGDDPDMLRKMRIGQLQAGVISMNGLAEIDETFKVFRLPLFFASYDEMRAVLAAMKPDLERRLAAKGFVLLNWSEVGWVYLFSAKPVATVPELKSSKMFSFAGDDQMTSWWKQQGFQPVAIATTDIPTALQTGCCTDHADHATGGADAAVAASSPHAAARHGAAARRNDPDQEDLGRDLARGSEENARGRRSPKRLQEEAGKQDKVATDEMVKRGLKIGDHRCGAGGRLAQGGGASPDHHARSGGSGGRVRHRAQAARRVSKVGRQAGDQARNKAGSLALNVFLRRSEQGLAAFALAVMVVLPLAEMVAREVFHTGISGSQPIVQNLVLWVGFLGAALAAREGRLLALATGEFLPQGALRRWSAAAATAVGAGVAMLLARASFDLVKLEYETGERIAIAPIWAIQLVLPLAFTLIAWRLVRRTGPTWRERTVAAVGALAGLLLSFEPQWLAGHAAWPGLLIVAVETLLGAPLFSALGGAAILLFMAAGEPIAAVPIETYRLAVNAALPAIPLFTLTGFVLAEGKAPERLLRLFRGLFGWVPGARR